jgi:eukaryotic-like serine/threonine-protein kinase
VPSQLPARFGPYEVIAPLGAGGYGSVVRAHDPRLKRAVAIKVLSHAGTDPRQHQRLLDEAQAASALNHPNIVTVHDVGLENGVPYVVSELVEGTSLRAMADRAPLPVRELLDLAVQMADGLAAAHQAGIVHRDFKPENVMVTRDGRVKILDFGLALVVESGAGAEALETVSQSGAILAGTVPYMSPEQARGAAVDFRTDQFSLGLTLYELSTGRRAFRAETSAQVLAAILDDEPEPIGKLNPKVPLPVRWVIERCLAKDPRQRYDSTMDLARDLRMLRDRVTEFTPASEVAPAPAPISRWRIWTGVAAGLIAFAAIGWFARSVGADRFSLDRYHWTPFATDAGYQGSPAWSPDGKTLAYVAEIDGVLQVFTRELGSATRQQVTKAQFDCREPFWSQDGTRLYYISQARDREGLYSISTASGEPEIVMEDVSSAALSPDGKTLAFFRENDDSQTRKTLWLSALQGSPPTASPPSRYAKSFAPDIQIGEGTLHFSPDGTKLGAWIEILADPSGSQTQMQSQFWILPMDGGAPRRLPAPPLNNLAGLAPSFSWLPDNRHIVSSLPDPEPGMHLWTMDTESETSRLLTSTGGLENDPAVSPNRTMALSLQQADYDLYRLSTDHPSAVMDGPSTSRNEMDPTWSAVNSRMAFVTDRSGHEEIWLRSQEGDWQQPLVTSSAFNGSPTYLLSAPAFSPDGGRLAYNRAGPEGYQIWISPVAGGPPIQLDPSGTNQDSPSWSLKGDWVWWVQFAKIMKMRVGARARPEVVVSPVVPYSPLQWAPDGTWVAFNSPAGLSVVSPETQAVRVMHEQIWMAFAWSADSKRIYGIRQSDDLKHLTFTAMDIASGAEHVVSADIMPLPVSSRPVRGLTRLSPTTFLASIAKVRSDVWLLEGFQPEPSFWERAGAALHLTR